MDGGVPCTDPHEELRSHCLPLLDACNTLFLEWYRQQHSCNTKAALSSESISVIRLMTFITRYTPAPGEEALLKHVDGAGKVDGSIVVALPIDRWSDSEEINSFEGGGLTVWDGKNSSGTPLQIDYATRNGDLAFLDRWVDDSSLAIRFHTLSFSYMVIYRAVWHQGTLLT